MNRNHGVAFLAAVFLLAQPTPAAAVDLGKATRRVLDHLGELGIGMEWETLTVLHDEAYLTNVVIHDADARWWAERIYLREFSERPTYYQVGMIHIPLLASQQDQWRVRIERLKAYGLRAPLDESPLPAGSVIDFDEAGFARFSMDAGGITVFRAGDGHIQAVISDDHSGVSYKGAIETFAIETQAIGNPIAREAALAMGFQPLNGYLEFDWSMRGRPAGITVNYLGLSLADAGTVSISGDIVPDNASEIPFEGIHRAGILMDRGAMGLREATLRFDDEGLTAKLLDHAAKVQGSNTDTVKFQAQALAMMQAGAFLGLDNVPRFLSAVQAFLSAPESIEIRANPAHPVPFAALEGLDTPAMAKRLSLEFAAND